jgi:hypothetical protein
MNNVTTCECPTIACVRWQGFLLFKCEDCGEWVD